MNQQPPSAFPDILLERYLLGELPAGSREALRKRLEEDAALRRRLESLSAADRAMRETLPPLSPRKPAGMKPSPLPRSDASRAPSSWRRPILWAAGPAFASLALFAVVAELGPRGASGSDAVPGNIQVTETGVEPGIRLKGVEAGLAIYRKTRSGRPELLPPRSAARAGDTLQIFYQAYRELHGVIFSVDGSGSLTLHLPEASGPAARLEQGGLRPLPHAYLLDRAPRLERFYLVTSPAPFAVDSLLALARPGLASGPPDSLSGLPAGFRQHAYTLLKPDRNSARSTKGEKP